jgi:copper resistance protein C
MKLHCKLLLEEIPVLDRGEKDITVKIDRRYANFIPAKLLQELCHRNGSLVTCQNLCARQPLITRTQIVSFRRKFMNGALPRYFLIVIFALCFAQEAFAHAFLDKSDPKVGSTITVSPTEVKIWFTDDTQPDKSFIQVFDAADGQVDTKDTHADPKDKSVLVVSIPTLAPGTYKVHWHAVCSYSHRTQGNFQFTIVGSK